MLQETVNMKLTQHPLGVFLWCFLVTITDLTVILAVGHNEDNTNTINQCINHWTQYNGNTSFHELNEDKKDSTHQYCTNITDFAG